jgi:hypothetical protein
VGAVFGLTVALMSPHRGTAPWVVWASLAIFLTISSGAVFGYGLARWPEIAGLAPVPVRVRRAAAFVGQIAIVGIGFTVLGAVLLFSQGADSDTATGQDLSGVLLSTFVAFAVVPVGFDFAAIREHALAPGGPPGEQVEQILTLRRLLAGLLGAFGALVALATLALGAALRQGSRSDSAIVVIFGAVWSVILAFAYVPAAGALRDGARTLCRAAVPLADVSAADLPARVEERRKLEQALGVDRGILADVQSGLVIFAPLLASATAVFLPK